MKHKYILAALAASALVISCQQEENGPAQLEIVKTEELSLVLGDAPKSKVTVDGTTGDIAWNNGSDKVAVYVQGTGANEFQEKTVTDDAISVPLASGQSRAYFAVYPATSAVAAHYGNDYLAVQYPTSYDLTGMTVSAIETYSPVPMVADNTGSDALTFYHVGGLLRLSVAQTPATTTEIVVTFTGADVTGTWTVTGGGTTSATLSSPTGTGNVVTYTMDALESAQTVTFNVPIPQGSYTGLTAIRVDAKDSGSTTLASYTYSVTPAWASVTRALGRKEALSFADATLEITSPAATIWKGLTTTYTASSDAAVTWTSDTPGVATVDSDGVVTGVSAGTANITASTNGGLVVSDPVAVYVNAVTGVSLAPASVKVNKDVTTPLTATITHSNNGTITSYPFVLTFLLNSYSYVRFNNSSGNASVAVTPVSATSTTATGAVNAFGYALGGSAATMTVTVPEGVFSGSNSRTATASVICDDMATITFPDWNDDGEPDGERYKFRGYYLSPGILKYDGNSETGSYGYTLTDGSDPLEILQHYYYDYNDTGKGFDGTAATHFGLNVYYHAWAGTNSLNHRLHGITSTNISANITRTITIAGQEWRIPTGNSGEWDEIITLNTEHPIKINGYTYSENAYGNYVQVRVNLADATIANGAAKDYNNKGLNSGNSAGSRSYQEGILLIPDGAEIQCARISGASNGYSSNTLNWDDLRILTNGGCVFMPLNGNYSTTWDNAGSQGYYWTRTYVSNNNSYFFLFTNGTPYTGSNGNTRLMCVKLIHN